MNVFQRIFNGIRPSVKEEKREYPNHTQWLRRNWPTELFEDVIVDETTALKVSYVYAAINGISTDISSIDWPILRRDGNVIKEVRDHDQYLLLNERPYFAYNDIVWKRSWVANYLATGDGFSEIIRNPSTNRPIGYRLYHKKDIRVVVEHKRQDKYYEVIPEKNRRIDEMDMLHLSDLSYDGETGIGRIGLARKSLQIYKRSDDTQKEVQESATLLSGYVKIDRVLDEEQLKMIKSSFENAYGGSKGGVAVLDESMEFTPFDYTMNLADAEFIASRKFTGEDILRWFRYPQHMAGNLDRMTDNNIEQISIEYVNYCLRPIVKLMEKELNYKLLRPTERPQTYIKGKLKSLLRGDIETRMRFYETMWKIGALTPNMALVLEDMNPVDGGDKVYTDLQKIPVELVNDYWLSKIELNNDKANSQTETTTDE